MLWMHVGLFIGATDRFDEFTSVYVFFFSLALTRAIHHTASITRCLFLVKLIEYRDRNGGSLGKVKLFSFKIVLAITSIVYALHHAIALTFFSRWYLVVVVISLFHVYFIAISMQFNNNIYCGTL